MDDANSLHPTIKPTATRPLLGLTILVVEDSLYACDALRLLCLRSGARIRRADCLTSARRHLQVYRPSVAIIDQGLPDGSGAELIAELASAVPRVDVILGTSGDSFAEDIALSAGADGFLAKPLASVVAFQSAILDAMPPGRMITGPRLVSDDPVRPDPLAYRDDMAHAADLLNVGDDSTEDQIDYLTQFLGGVARSAGDSPLCRATEKLARSRAGGAPFRSDLARVSALVQERLAEQIAI